MLRLAEYSSFIRSFLRRIILRQISCVTLCLFSIYLGVSSYSAINFGDSALRV